MVAVTRSQTKRKREQTIRGEDFPLPRNVLVKVAELLKKDEHHLSLLAFSLTDVQVVQESEGRGRGTPWG